MQSYVVSVQVPLDIQVRADGKAEARRRAHEFLDWWCGLGAALLAEGEGALPLDAPERSEAFVLGDPQGRTRVRPGQVKMAEGLAEATVGALMRQLVASST